MFDPELWTKCMELSLGAVASPSWGCCAVGHCCSQVVLRMTGTRQVWSAPPEASQGLLF